MKKTYQGLLLTGLFSLLLVGLLGCNNNFNQKVNTSESSVLLRTNVNGVFGSNLALNKPATASSSFSNEYQPNKAVDGDQNTRWAAKTEADQWLAVDLGEVHPINQVIIKWSTTNYPKTYALQRLEGSNWVNIQSVTSDGGLDTININNVNVQKIRLNCTQPNSTYYVVYEFEVYSNEIPPSPTPSVIPSPIITPSPIPSGMKDFTLKDLNNQEVTLSSFLGKKILLNFAGSHCGPCVREFPVLQQLYDKQLSDIVVLVVCHGSSLQDVKNVLGQYTFKALYTTDYRVFDLYGVDATPTNVFLNRQGQEFEREVGFGNETADHYLSILNRIP